MKNRKASRRLDPQKEPEGADLTGLAKHPRSEAEWGKDPSGVSTRFRDKLRATIERHNLFSPGDTIVVAVSGGPDSLALLHALRTLSPDLKIKLHVAHLNHQLRGGESDADAEFVVKLADDWDLPATLEARDVAAHAGERKMSLEEAARQVRYAFLAEVAQRVGASAVAVAHNADDQVETVLMHLLRGSGMAGLRGMLFKSPLPESAGGPAKLTTDRSPLPTIIVRPLLDVTRAEIESYCRENGLAPRFDRSNLDTTLFRNRLRQEVLPYLQQLNPNLRQVLHNTARALADDYDLLQEQVKQAFKQVAQEQENEVTFMQAAWRSLHPALQRGTLRLAIQALRRELRDINWVHVEEARRIALEKGTGSAVTLPRGLRLTIGYDRFTIADASRVPTPPDIPLLYVETLALALNGRTELPGSDWVVDTELAPIDAAAGETGGIQARIGGAERWNAVFDASVLRGDLVLRRRRPGDRFQPAGLGGRTKSLHEFMIDKKIPQAIRDRLPVLVAGEQILWVCGWRLDERARARMQARQLLHVTFRKQERT